MDIKGYLNTVGNGPMTNQLVTYQNYFRSWANATDIGRRKMGRDYEYASGNGKQWNERDRALNTKQGRPSVEINQILPQVEFIAGMQREMQLDFKTYPRAFNDVRLSEIASATLKASMDFGRYHRVIDQVFDDASICGLGAWEVLHSVDDAEDLVWGDIDVLRIHPQSFIYDPWSLRFDLQDGTFMGKAAWMDVDEFRRKYPKFAHLAVPGEWLSRVNQLVGSSDDLGTGPNLVPEVWDEKTGRIRILTLWHKVPTDIVLLVDEKSGETKEFDTKDNAELYKQFLMTQAGSQITGQLQIVSTGSVATFADPMGNPIPNPMTGQPMDFANTDMANTALNMIAQQVGLAAVDGIQIIKRTVKKPRWTEMVFWQILDEGDSPFRDRKYPFVPYISRRFVDDPEGIFGIVRPLWDPQDVYNKQYSNLLAHSNSSTHSGWLNKKLGGANTQELAMLGSKPGVVVEYTSIAPTQIQPTQLPPGHFAMTQASEKNILRISCINADMVGQNSQQTVSGRAIQARQSGGTTALKPRFRAFEEALLDLARIVFSRIQQFYPPEKIRRIIGSVEMSSPLGLNGAMLFDDPNTGMPVPEEQIFQFLEAMTDNEFDIVFALKSKSPSDRDAEFQRAIQMAQMIAQSGRPIGPATFAELVKMSDMPSGLARALMMDAMMPPTMPPTAGKGQPPGGGKPPANGDGASSGGGNSDSTPNKSKAAAARPNNEAQTGIPNMGVG